MAKKGVEENEGLSSEQKEGLSSEQKEELSSEQNRGLSSKQKKRAHRLLRNLLITLSVAFVAEILMRLFPVFLQGAPERDWLEWMLVSFIGVCTYLVWNVAIWYRRDDADFIAHTPWYQATAAKGPIIALAVLLALTNISFQAGTPTGEGQEGAVPGASFDFGVDFSQASKPVLLIVAFVLGYFSRFTQDLFYKIGELIFGKLWSKTYKERKDNGEQESQSSGKKDGGE